MPSLENSCTSPSFLPSRVQLDCDILVTGHTHQSQVMEVEGRYLINPGSLTGAFAPGLNDPVPSFSVLAVGRTNVKIYTYQLRGGEVSVDECAVARGDFPERASAAVREAAAEAPRQAAAAVGAGGGGGVFESQGLFDAGEDEAL